MSLDEKELLVDLILMMRNVEKDQKELIEKVESLDSQIWSYSSKDLDI